MKTIKIHRIARIALLSSAVFVTSTSWATLVTWNLNPGGLDQAVGSSSQSYTVSGYTITAYGYDNNAGIGTPHNLFYKNAGSDEIGLGLVNILHNELQVGSTGDPLQFIQLDLTSILAAGFVNGQISVGSVQAGESFNLYGSNTLGSLGTKLNSTPFDTTNDDLFVSVPNFGTYKFISVVAASFDVLPVAFRAQITPVPEVGTLMPIVILAVAVMAFEVRRRRAIA